MYKCTQDVCPPSYFYWTLLSLSVVYSCGWKRESIEIHF